MNLHDWIDELGDVLDVETEVDEGLVLDLARVAAHNVREDGGADHGLPPRLRRRRADANPEQVEQLAARAQALAEGWDRPADAPDPDDVDDEVPDDTSSTTPATSTTDERARTGSRRTPPRVAACVPSSPPSPVAPKS